MSHRDDTDNGIFVAFLTTVACTVGFTVMLMSNCGETRIDHDMAVHNARNEGYEAGRASCHEATRAEKITDGAKNWLLSPPRKNR